MCRAVSYSKQLPPLPPLKCSSLTVSSELNFPVNTECLLPLICSTLMFLCRPCRPVLWG